MNLGVFYKMADLKDNFREWLIQQGAKPGTITSYLSRLQKISHQNWDMLTINIIPLLVQYYELANKEYYLDRVTILQALEYFNTISDNIYKTTKSDIKLSLFDGQKDYFICDTDLKSLYDDVWLINRYLSPLPGFGVTNHPRIVFSSQLVFAGTNPSRSSAGN